MIADETGKVIEGERILVVGPYDDQFGPTEKTSTLLVDAKLKKEYDQLHVAIDNAKKTLIDAIQKQSGSRRDWETEISSAITRSDNKFDDAVIRIAKEIERQHDTPFATVQYDIIFNQQVTQALGAANLKDAVEDYVHRYNELLDGSTFFKKGTFDYYNAGPIARHLGDNGFFDAKHTVTLKGTGKTVEVNTQKELVDIVEQEKVVLMSDKELRKTFDSVAKKLDRNAAFRTSAIIYNSTKHFFPG